MKGSSLINNADAMIFSHGGNTACVGETFWKLSLALIDPDQTRSGTEYERLRHKLQKHFEKGECYHIDECVEETLHRLCQKISEGLTIRNVSGFAFGIAANVLREYWRQLQKYSEPPGDDLPIPDEDERDDNAATGKINCMKACLNELPAEEQELIQRYYGCDESKDKRKCRESLAAELDSSYGNLVVRVHRIREKLKACCADCLRKSGIS